MSDTQARKRNKLRRWINAKEFARRETNPCPAAPAELASQRLSVNGYFTANHFVF
jgi:hypothetical protein